MALVARVDGTARWLARLATAAALVGGVAGLVLWWSASGRGVHHLGQEAVLSLLVLALCLVPAGWLLNVRFALLALLELPQKLGEVTMRHASQLLGPAGSVPERNAGSVPERGAGPLGALGSLRGMVRDYGDVVGSWATVSQLVTPGFWALTALALVAVPILVIVAAIAGLVAAIA
ncbi:MAG: hypothetical protein M3256_11420 [Actinomycetota bacterium]|nr:hypothetical protein [Actinomycetota bacterium]MDQ6946848.1 hypothetical protein [Actinomycetota bacterium]